MSIENNAYCGATELDLLLPSNPAQELGEFEPTSFVELILMASEFSEDEGEVRDLVDSLFHNEQFELTDIREDQLSSL
ncbi:MAG: hypothetical protein IH881_08805 [Myxococcales bacterium]|nr:hypothetical protein [Myxococcales bacterium]